jgi:hypothetical protein
VVGRPAVKNLSILTGFREPVASGAGGLSELQAQHTC